MNEFKHLQKFPPKKILFWLGRLCPMTIRLALSVQHRAKSSTLFPSPLNKIFWPPSLHKAGLGNDLGPTRQDGKTIQRGEASPARAEVSSEDR